MVQWLKIKIKSNKYKIDFISFISYCNLEKKAKLVTIEISKISDMLSDLYCVTCLFKSRKKLGIDT